MAPWGLALLADQDLFLLEMKRHRGVLLNLHDSCEVDRSQSHAYFIGEETGALWGQASYLLSYSKWQSPPDVGCLAPRAVFQPLVAASQTSQT